MIHHPLSKPFRQFVKVGTVEEFMFKEGVRDILDKLDNDLVGLIPVKRRVREIAALLVLDKASGGGGGRMKFVSITEHGNH